MEIKYPVKVCGARKIVRPEFAAIPDLPGRIAALGRDLVSHGMLVPVGKDGGGFRFFLSRLFKRDE